MIQLGNFEPLVLHKYINVDGAWGAQCWDLIGYFTDWLGVPRLNTHGGLWHGWAYAIWDQYYNNGASLYWDRIPADQPAVQGDIVIWKVTPGYYPASHIALAIEDAGPYNLWTYSQNSAPSWANNPYPNDSTAPVIKQLLPKVGLAGYLRRKKVVVAADDIEVAPPTPKPKPVKKEWDEMASKEDFKSAIREVLLEPKTLDTIVLAVLKRECYLVDPSGKSGKVVGTTNLAKKINWMAHNDAQILNVVVAIGESLGVQMDEILDKLEDMGELEEAMPVLEATLPVPQD